MTQKPPSLAFRWPWVALLLAAAMVLMAGGYAYYRSETDRIREHKYEDLAQIAQLKAGQIREWRAEQMLDVGAFASGPLLRKALEQWFKDRNDQILVDDLTAKLVGEKRAGGYADAVFCSPDGRILISVRPEHEALSPLARATLADAIAKRAPVLSDLYRTEQGQIEIYAAGPILNTQGQPIAAALFTRNAESLLFPLIQSWPTSSRTAETLIVRREGDELLFLNNVRHRPHSALSMREPLTLKTLPAVQAVLGRRGMFEGKDYRGHEVLADLSRIPDSPWFMVAKVDSSEILSEARYRGAVIAVFCVLFFLLAVSFTAYGYRYRQAGLYQQLYEAEQKERESQEQFRTTLYSIGDAVITTDTASLVKQMNPVAESLTGWTEAEAARRPLHEVFNIIDEASRSTAENPVARVLREGTVTGLANHTLLIAKDGTERPIADSGAPIRNEDGGIVGVVLVFRDQTTERKLQKDLEESEERYRTVADHTYDWEFWITPDGMLAYCSPSCVRVTGFKASDFLRDPSLLNRIVHPEDESLWAQHSVQVVHSTERCEFDYRIVARNGDIVWIAHCCSPVYSRDGSFIGRRSSNRDITVRKQVEEDLLKSEQRYRATFNIASVGIDVVDSEGRFLEANHTLTQFLGYTADELRERTILDVTHPEDVSLSWDLHAAMVRGETEGYRFEKRYVRKDGAVVWSDTAVSAIRDPDGTYRATVGVIRDITQHKRSEEVRMRLATAVEQAAETVMITDASGAIMYVNPAFVRTTGYSAEEVLGKNPRILRSSRHDGEFYKQMWESITRGKVWTGRLINRKKDGSLFEEDASISPVKDKSGHIVYFVAVKRDITQEALLQTQLFQAQKMEAIGTLAGGVAHDFNNILQVALGYSELILTDEELPRQFRSDLRKIHDSARRGADLVQRLLTFSRKTDINPVPLNLNRRLAELRKMLERTLPKMIDIQLLLGKNISKINADPTQIDQILMNLGVNARDAMPDGGKLIFETSDIVLEEEYAMTHLEAKPGPYVLLKVTDTGSGMSKETLEHIFEPFYTTKPVGQGTGLGLAMVHGIVKQHGGHISCYSAPGRGTTFSVYFPALAGQEESGEATAREMPRGGTETILLVDDEEYVRDLGSRILSRAGYEVIVASDGREALEQYRANGREIDLIILDLVMPEMGGEQCLQSLLTLSPSAKVLITSGYALHGPAVGARDLGAKGLISKPFRLEDLLEHVRTALDET